VDALCPSSARPPISSFRKEAENTAKGVCPKIPYHVFYVPAPGEKTASAQLPSMRNKLSKDGFRAPAPQDPCWIRGPCRPTSGRDFQAEQAKTGNVGRRRPWAKLQNPRAGPVGPAGVTDFALRCPAKHGARFVVQKN